MKVALLSNINMNPVLRMLKDELDVFEPEGFGNELGIMLNRQSSLYSFHPNYIFLMEDIAELTSHSMDMEQINAAIEKWFHVFENVISTDCIYYVSDAYFYLPEFETVWTKGVKLEIENAWEKRLELCVEEHANVRIFRYRRLIEKMGETESFSLKMWYMGKILHSMNMLRLLSDEIKKQIAISERVPKKVLILDLDNTLWGGLAGENDITPIILSEEKTGLAYKNFQRMIFWMKEQGVILCIVSKNNESDALDIIRNHPHMVLRENDFSAQRINWKPKHENIMEIAGELNLGLDSFVFVDDNPAERKLVQEFLPSVTVPEFDPKAENLTSAMESIYHEYFEKPVVTVEDKNKTEQYHANQMRRELKDKAVDFDSYLESLDISLIRVDPKKNEARFVQLMNKTNQFNLTTKRFSEDEAAGILNDVSKEVFMYRVTDCFGDNGIVSVSIVDYAEKPTVIEFVMSCRVMGRQIENAVIEEMEKAAKRKGYEVLDGLYKATDKNKPVASLYSSLGYVKTDTLEDGTEVFEMDLGNNNVSRKFILKIQEEP